MHTSFLPDHLLRRRFLKLASLGVLGFISPRLAQCFTLGQVEILDVRTISRDEVHYHGWPTLLRRMNGDLLVVFSGAREAHVDPFGRVDMIVSHDQGKTWSWPRTLLDGDIDERDAGILETKDGSLIVTTFTSLAYASVLDTAKREKTLDNSTRERWLSVHNRLNPEQRKAELGQWIIRSTDGGRTWSARYPSIVNSPHGPIQLADGRLLYAGRELSGGRARVGVAESSDDGVTWHWLADIPFDQGHDYTNYHELNVVEARSGKIVLQLRYIKRGELEQILQSESADGGRSWLVPRPIGVYGYPSHLVRLSDNRILMSYGFRINPTGIRARLSADEGKTWGDEMMISADGATSDLGYPSTVQLAEGDFLTVWYERLRSSRFAVLRQAKWRLSNRQ